MKTFIKIPTGERCWENDEITFDCKIYVNDEIELDNHYTLNMRDVPKKIYPVVHKLMRNCKTGEESETIVKW